MYMDSSKNELESSHSSVTLYFKSTVSKLENTLSFSAQYK